MSLYVKKIGLHALWPRFNAFCANLTTFGGDLLAWVVICRYLGVYFSSARTFKCYFDNCKASFTAHLTPFTVVLVVVLVCIYYHPNVCQYCYTV